MRLFTIGPEHYARYGSDERSLRTLAAFNRINALSCIKSAEHGWLGASYSVAEMLTVLYFGLGEHRVVLSKGHAAAMQYACLVGRGLLRPEALLSYKDGPSGLSAHTDRRTPGILLSTGSLGQALSQTAGLAHARRVERFYVVLGDGELQEGQCFEALQTIAHQDLRNLTVLLDRNGFQSELAVERVKRIADYESLLRGLGLEAALVDGHSPSALLAALGAPADRPRAVIARTCKAGGTALLQPEGERQPWHGRVPDDDLYWAIVTEQAALAGDAVVQAELESLARQPRRARPAAPSKEGSTGTAFARRLEALAEERSDLVVLDADLAAACQLHGLARRPGQFVELGISEQDMVSFAGGLALGGRLPVVNTYAAFYRRAIDQLYSNQLQGSRVIYAGHYAGLCYFTDGNTHQSTSDLSLMLALPGLTVVEPVTPRQTELLLDWAVRSASSSVYFRLRRTPLLLDLPEPPAAPDRPLALPGGRRWFITTGTVSTRLALDCRRRPDYADWGLLVQSVFHGPLDRDAYLDLLRDAEEIITVEEDAAPGALRSFVGQLTQELGLAPRIRGKCIDRWGASFRTLESCLAHYGFTAEQLTAGVR